MGNVFRDVLDGWSDLDITMNGEAVINYHVGSSFILTKIKSLPVTMDVLVLGKKLHQKLSTEVDNRFIASKTFLSEEGVIWYTDLYSVDNDRTKFYHFCYAELKGRYLILQSSTDCINSVSLLSDSLEGLLCAINFDYFLQESGCLECNGKRVTVTALSDLHVQVPEIEDLLFFLGENCYYAISLEKELDKELTSRCTNLVNTLQSDAFVLIQKDVEVRADRQAVSYVVQHDTVVLGFVRYEEFIVADDLVVSVIAYGKSSSTLAVNSNLGIEVA